MPWSVTNSEAKCSASEPWAVVNDDSGQVEGCHATKTAAESQQAALYANTEEESKSMSAAPRDDLVRMIPFSQNPQWPSEMVMRMAEDGNTLIGYAAVFDRWTEINSWEGRFKERISKGAFRKTIKENRNAIKVLFNHGMDPSIGDKPLGKPSVMKEDKRGLYVEVPLDDTSYNQDLKASLKSGALDGMSFRMNVIRDEWDDLESELPERTIKEIRMFEFGPVTFPAYEATEAGVRAHAPKAFAAFRAAGQEPVVEKARQEAMTVSTDDSTGALIGSRMSYVYTPSTWAGWTPHSMTDNGVTLYVRSVPPGDQTVAEPTESTPEDTATVTDTDGETVDEKVVVTDVESDSDTIAAPEESEDTAGDAPGDDHPSQEAPVDEAHSSSDAPSDSAHSSTEEQPRMKPWRKTMMLDRINDVVDKVEAVDVKRYRHLL